MSVAFDKWSGSVGINPSHSHVPVGTPRAVVAWAITGGAWTATTPLYGGVALNPVSISPITKATGEAIKAYAYFLGSGIPTGSQAASLQTGGATVAWQLMTLTAAADTEIVDAKSISSDSVANPTVVLSLGGRSCWCGIGFGSGQDAIGGIAPNAGWSDTTPTSEVDGGTITIAAFKYDTIGTADVTAGWTQTLDDAVVIAVAIAEVSAGTAKPEHFYRLMRG